MHLNFLKPVTVIFAKVIFARAVFVGAFFASMLSCQKTTQENQRKTPVELEREFPIQDKPKKVFQIDQITPEPLIQEITVPQSEIYVDSFKQAEQRPPQIDILIVVDNSFSMEQEQVKMSDQLPTLLADLVDVDWRINVITTDNYCKRIPELPLLPDSENLDTHYRNAIKAGVNGSGYEIGLTNAYHNLSGRCGGENWKRPDVDLAIFILSDEDVDRSTSRYYRKPDLWINHMAKIGYEVGVNYKVYGIIDPNQPPCHQDHSYGKTYEDVINATGGMYGDVCSFDYETTMREISRDMRKDLQLEFPLTYAPVVTTIVLEIDGVFYSGDWTLVGQSVILSEPLPEGSKLNIRYQTQSQRYIALRVDPKKFLLEKLTLDGEPIDPSRYSYDNAANTVLLMFDPTPGSLIQTFLTDQSKLLNNFAFPQETIKEMQCFVDERRLHSENKVENSVLTLLPPAPVGKTTYCLYL